MYIKTIAQQINWNFETNGKLEIRDKNGRIIYRETPNKNDYWYKWERWEYNSRGHRIYYGNSLGAWVKWEYNDENQVIYHENSSGLRIDNRPKPCENKVVEKCEDKVVEIDGIKYKLVKQ